MSIEAAAEFSGKTVDELNTMSASQGNWQTVFTREYERLRGLYTPGDAAMIAEYYAERKTR